VHGLGSMKFGLVLHPNASDHVLGVFGKLCSDSVVDEPQQS
jgi:hypothetical protein